MSLPSLATPLGPLGIAPGAGGPAAILDAGAAFTVTGRRLVVRGGGAGVEEVWAYPFHVLNGPRIRGARPTAAVSMPRGVERSLDVGGVVVTERIVVSRDAPVAWLEWVAGRAVTATVEWSVDRPGRPADPGSGWEVESRGLWVDGGVFVFSAEPETLEVAGSGMVRVRARIRIPDGDGLRLALASASEQPDRLLKVADRTRVAVLARAGSADRTVKDGLRVTASDPELGPAVDRQRIELALQPRRPVGPWSPIDLAGQVQDHLAAGESAAALEVLAFLARNVGEDGAPPRKAEPVAGGRDAAVAAFIHALARYMAWTGDRSGAREAWPAALRSATPGRGSDAAAPSGLPGPLRELARVAEELGEAEAATALQARAGGGDEEADPAIGPSGALGRVVVDLLGAEPDATRGRLVLRPRPPADWTGFEVRGLAVGDAEVDVVYSRERGRHRLVVRQERGAAPLQLVLEPELAGRVVTGTWVDGEPAELDVAREPKSGDRWLVPVQLALDHPRTLEVEVSG